jgi:acyl carrier protein
LQRLKNSRPAGRAVLLEFDFPVGLGYVLWGEKRAGFSAVAALLCRAAPITTADASNGWRIRLMSDAVAEKVISTLASVKRIPADTIKLDTNLQDLGIDSLDVFTLLFELENAFKISIPDDDVRSLRTVNDVVEGIKKIIAAAPPDASLGSATPAD